jgi:transglutaminase-like putative cysteine protease
MKTPLLFSLPFMISLVGCGSSATAPDPSLTELAAAEVIAATQEGIKRQQSKASSRAFVFHYDFRLHGLQPGTPLKVWLPVPQTNEWQVVKPGEMIAPVVPTETFEARYSNKMQHFDFAVPESGEASFRIPYEVTRKEVRLEELDSDDLLPGDLFLTANNKVPIEGKATSLLGGVALPLDPIKRARAIYDLVDDHVKYSKDGEGWGQGDSEWVCDSRFGNCTDFHSLFISLARSKGIHARFEIGFPIAPDVESGLVGGYHCWGWFHVDGKGWVPVDISEADKHPEMKEYYFGNVTADRVAFSTGRDLVLEPKQSRPPLNFFVYPYAEVDGNVLDRKHVELKFAFDTPGHG